jgi:hypothetical protein
MYKLTVLLTLLLCTSLFAEANPQPSPGKLPRPIKEGIFIGPNGSKTLTFFVTKPMTIVASARVSGRKFGKPTRRLPLLMTLKGPSKRMFMGKRGDFPVMGLQYHIDEALGNREFKHGTRWQLTFTNQSKRNFAGQLNVEFYELGAFQGYKIGQGQKPIRSRYFIRQKASQNYPIKVDVPATIKVTVRGHKKSSVIAEVVNPHGQVMTSRNSAGTFNLNYEVGKHQIRKGRKWKVRIKNPSKKKGRFGNVHIIVLRKSIGEIPEDSTKVERITLRGKKSKTLPLKITGPCMVHFKGQHPRKGRDRGGEKPRQIKLIGPKGKVYAEHVGKLPLQFNYQVTKDLAKLGTDWKLVLFNPSRQSTGTLVFYGARGEANPQPSP